MNEQGKQSSGERDIQAELDELKLAQAVEAATQSATMAGQTATTAATFMGTWSTIAAGTAMFVVGIFVGLAIRQS